MQTRKATRLSNYDYSQNGAYFITICVQNRYEMFGKIVGGDAHIAPSIKLSQYGFVVEKYIQSVPGIEKYIIMPNHIHMIISIDNGAMPTSPPTQTISQRIKSFKTLVTKEIGFTLWQRSFHDRIIRNDVEYREIWEYIDANPSTWLDDCFYNKSKTKM